MSRQPQQSAETPSLQMLLDIRLLAVLGFVVGIIFHVWVVFAVLEDSSEPDLPSLIPNATIEAVTPTPAPTVLPDRTDCEEIRGTQYRSPSERQYFLETCI